MSGAATRLWVFDHFIAQLVDGIDAGVHKHGAYQLSVSLDGRPHRCGPSPKSSRLADGHVVAPNTPHCLDSVSGRQALFWIAPHSEMGLGFGARRVDESGFGTFEAAEIGEGALRDMHLSFDPGVPTEVVRARCEALVESLVDSPFSDAAGLHPSVAEAVAIIHAELATTIGADELARRVGLSTSRLLHLFKEQMGTPLRPHVQWLRLVDAMVQIIGGTSVTDAAARAGFADGAHLARTINQYLGLRASELAGNPDIVVEVCLTAPTAP